MTATSIQVRRRSAARRMALARQQKLNEERRRRDEQELDLAAEFAVRNEECVAARAQVHAAELALGQVVDRLIGGLRLRYERAAQLLDMPEDELKRLRQIAADTPAEALETPRGPRPARRGRPRRTEPAPTAAPDNDTTTPRDPRQPPGVAVEPGGP